MNNCNEDAGLFQIFLAEARDHIEAAEESLLRLGKNPEDQFSIQECFRAMHTLKGCSAFFQLHGIEKLSHACEQALDALRAGRCIASNDVIDVLLECTSRISELLVSLASIEDYNEFSISESGQLTSPDQDLIQQVLACTGTANGKSDNQASSNTIESAASLAEEFISEAGDLLDAIEQELLKEEVLHSESIREIFRGAHTLKGIASYLGENLIAESAHVLEEMFTNPENGQILRSLTDDQREIALTKVQEIRSLVAKLNLPANDCPLLEAQQISDANNKTKTPTNANNNSESTSIHIADVHQTSDDLPESLFNNLDGDKSDRTKPEQIESYSRIATSRLEDLINLVGELSVSHAFSVRRSEMNDDQEIGFSLSQHGRILRQLQMLVLSMRMVPMRGVFRKMARAVHDAARRCGKQIHLETSGDETEIDRSVSEAIADPLLHLVRNAVDHGIEENDERLRAGKAPTGHVKIAARQIGDHVIITVSDDGHGINFDRVREKAIARNLIDKKALVSQKELTDVLFMPGFTTRENVSELSGRGVGLDVVRSRIEKLKGTVDLQSEYGSGCTFLIQLPLTTAIIDALDVRCNDESYLLPISTVMETKKLVPGILATILGRGSIYEFRGKSLPVIRLSHIFEHIESHDDHQNNSEILLVIDGQSGRFALVVDELRGVVQAVIKPLPSHLKHHPGLSGSAILSDGKIGFILDPNNLLALEMSCQE